MSQEKIIKVEPNWDAVLHIIEGNKQTAVDARDELDELDENESPSEFALRVAINVLNDKIAEYDKSIQEVRDQLKDKK